MKKKSLIVSLIVSMSLLIVGCNNGKSTSVKNNSKDDNSISTYANNENNDSKDSITAYVGNNILLKLLSKKNRYVKIFLWKVTNVKGGYIMDIQKKEELKKEVDRINETITPKDIKEASTEELAEYLKLNLEIKRKIELIEAIKNN